MGTILQTSDYPAIRAKLGVTTNDLPDADIDTIGLLPVTEAMIMSFVTDYATILSGGGNNSTFLKAATLCWCAALAAYAKLQVQRGQSFRVGDYQESETKVDWMALGDKLALEARGYMLLISTHTPTTRNKLLVVAGPTSSSSNWPTVIAQWIARIQPHFATWLSDGGVKLYSWENQP